MMALTQATVNGCAAAGVPRCTWYDWMESDASFAALVVDASGHVSDELEEEAIARAKSGSDTLLMFLLKARRPAIYREKHTITVVSPEVVTRLGGTRAQARRTLCAGVQVDARDRRRAVRRVDGRHGSARPSKIGVG